MGPLISKDFGLRKILEKRSFILENLCSFGDADNDYVMIMISMELVISLKSI